MTTAERLLADDLLLLSWDVSTGRPRSAAASQLPTLIGGALLIDLARRGHLRLEMGRPRANGRRTGEPLLDDVATAVREGSPRRKLRSWIRKIGTAERRDAVRDRLVDRGLLLPETRRILGVFASTRHRVADAAALEQLATSLGEVLTGDRPGDERTAVLAALVGGTVLIDRVVAKPARREARERAAELAEASAFAAATRSVIRDTQAATTATLAAGAAVVTGR